MNTRISSKFAALAVALMMNSLIVAGVALVFNNSVQHTAGLSLAAAQNTAVHAAV